MINTTAFLLIVGVLLFLDVASKKILIVPLSAISSQYFNCLKLGEEMASRGHEVLILTTPYLRTRSSTVKHIEYDVPNGDTMTKFYDRFCTGSQKAGILPYLQETNGVMLFHVNTCLALLRNERTLKALKETDIIITIPMMFCGTYLADIFDKPFLIFHPATFSAISSLLGGPILPSYVPVALSKFTDEMNFFERTANFLLCMIKNFVVNNVISYYFKALQTEYGGKSRGNFAELFKKAEMYIIGMDFVYEYTHPLMPDVLYVGPLLPKPPSKLPEDFEDFMSSSGDDGVVLISFGSMISNVKEETTDRMMTAISRLKQKVIWKARFKSEENRTLPSNLIVVNWVPQNDILGHPKTKAFVSHMGVNGLAEAAFHGVPIVAACIFSDNHYNAIVFEKKTKMIKYIDIFNADSDTWQRTIEEVIHNTSYKENAMKTSKLLRSWPKSNVERAGDLVQYAIDNDGRLPHLKSYADKLYWFQYHCLDVITFLLTCFGVVALLFIKVLKLLSSVICNRKKTKKD